MDKSAAELLSEARIRHVRLPELPEASRPKDAAEAYQCQSVVVANWLSHYGGEVSGYKIACTNSTAQRQLSVPGPFWGQLLSALCFASPARLDASQFFMRVIEAEFGFRMARNLPPGAAPRSHEDIVDAVEGVIPSIEIVDSRFDDWLRVGAPSLISDNACNAAWVHGPLVADWRELNLVEQPVTVTVNGQLVRKGSGAAVLGSPLNALAWLVDALSARGIGLRAGQYITTGVTTEVYFAEQGDHVIGDFGAAGTAEVEFY
ncbi:MAG: fumarylacetoacetate hydrolase family protein [Acidobacteriia bacterium]|nr:fumarylacetoacetate hydrolase family protein [Terriglobia bacterium]MBV8903673.1 fumarylacetoacetate hydrolase family protein [Terriglobia bacterium]